MYHVHMYSMDVGRSEASVHWPRQDPVAMGHSGQGQAQDVRVRASPRSGAEACPPSPACPRNGGRAW